MSTSLERFFNIQELVDLLAAHLDKKEMSQLSRTTRSMHKLCTPSRYRTLLIGAAIGYKLFTSTPALLALARNSQHVRALSLDLDEFAFFYNCVLVFQDMSSHIVDTPSNRPPWLPSPDAHIYQLVAMPPMTRLSRLTLCLDGSRNSPYRLPSVKNPRATLAQLCWLTSLSPLLTFLSLHVPIFDLFCCRRLGEALSGLRLLKELRLWIYCMDETKIVICSYLLFSCPPSTQRLSMCLLGDYRAYQALALGHPGEKWESIDVNAADRKQEPIINLEDLSILGIRNWGLTFHVHSIFAHCPNVKMLALSAINGNLDAHIIGRLIGSACPRIESLQYGSPASEALDSLPFDIMDSLPAQQFANLTYNGSLVNFSNLRINTAFHRHSASIRSIAISAELHDARISTSAILKECHALETFHISFQGNAGHYITLADAVEFPWSCTKLTQLTLAISGCELPVEPGFKPYYYRRSPITLTNAETQHFAQLEILYRQIGMLTRLTFLKLIMVKLNGQGQVNGYLTDAPASFPAMLGLENVWTGRPGYLHHLSGLKSLRRLEGAFGADTEETRRTMEYPEMIWMDSNWPVLEYADFFEQKEDVRAPFTWLKNKRDDDGRDELKLGSFSLYA